MAILKLAPACLRAAVAVFVVGGGCLLAADGDAPEPFNIPLWQEGQVPMARGTGPIDNPLLTVFLPPESKRNGSSVIIAPGGANTMLMYGAEGFEVGERLNDMGFATFVLTYRLRPYPSEARALDGMRAVQHIRSRASEWKLNPDRVGFMGFSAGSFVGWSVARAAKPGNPDAADPLDRWSSRPDFLVLVYGPGRPSEGEDLTDLPPTFLLAAAADKGAANGSAQLFQKLNDAGVTVELHLFQKGRHGFGSAATSPEFGPWLDMLAHFLKVGGFYPEVH
jgi:endo-1,4-beta-xylanase